MPEPGLSEALEATVAVPPSVIGFGVTTGASAGFVLSILKGSLRAAPATAVLPARSVKAGLPTVTAAPSPLVVDVPVLVDEGPAKPERPSVAVNVAVTSTFHQPLAFTAGDALVYCTAGASVSIFTVASLASSSFPTLSVE